MVETICNCNQNNFEIYFIWSRSLTFVSGVLIPQIDENQGSFLHDMQETISPHSDTEYRSSNASACHKKALSNDNLTKLKRFP
jgi:hypothetical protein